MTDGPRKRRPPVQARAAETRRRILQTAREAFAEYGFSGANVRSIAREAGATHSMITYHFGSKDELWREAVRDMFALLQQEVTAHVLEAISAGAGLKEQYRTLVHRYVRYCARYPEHARITISEAIRGGDRLHWMSDEFIRTSHRETSAWLRRLMNAGVVRNIPVESLLYSIVGMVQLPFVLNKEAELAIDHDFTVEESMARHAEAILTLTMADHQA